MSLRYRLVVNLIKLYLKRFVSKGGVYVDILQGISLGCSLSPLMGALYLKPLDDEMSNLDLFYARYMDDWVILAPTRWKLRHAVIIVNRVLNLLLVVKHPDKTFIGRISRGFDFLGFWFSSYGITIAAKSYERIFERASRLYELDADLFGIEKYLLRAIGWFVLGLSRLFLVNGHVHLIGHINGYEMLVQSFSYFST